jgi:hypothetical protein
MLTVLNFLKSPHLSTWAFLVEKIIILKQGFRFGENFLLHFLLWIDLSR